MKQRRPRFTRAIDIVEAGYDLAADDARWLENVLQAAAPDLEMGGITSAYVAVWRDGDLQFPSPIAVAGRSPRDAEAIRALNASAPARYHATVAATVAQFGSAVDVLGRLGDATLRDAQAVLRRVLPGVDDAICATARAGGGYSLQLYAASDARISVPRRTTAGWRRVLLHLGNGLRLRRRLRRDPEAVLAPNGKLVHAVGPARDLAARQSLADAVRRVERARGGLRRSDPGAAVALWSGLVDGRWSLVDQWERDGRRYLAAIENAPETPDPRGLSPVERAYLDYFLRGVPTTEIAFAFGRAVPTVGHALSSIVRRLGLPSRAALARFADPRSLQRVGLDGIDVLVVEPPAVHPRWFSVLTDAEIETALLAAAGRPDKEIAIARGVSPRTVGNQLASVFAKARSPTRAALARTLADAPGESPLERATDRPRGSRR